METAIALAPGAMKYRLGTAVSTWVGQAPISPANPCNQTGKDLKQLNTSSTALTSPRRNTN